MMNEIGTTVRVKDPVLSYEVAHIFEDSGKGSKRIAYAPDRGAAERFCIQRMKDGHPYTWYAMYYWTDHEYDPAQGIVLIEDIGPENMVLEV